MIVYEITNSANGKVYVGQTMDGTPKRRWYFHRYHLKRGTHKNPHLQSAWNLHGEGSFVFTEVQRARHGLELNELEIAQIAYRMSADREYGYNIFLGGEGSGLGHSPETRAKISESNKGKKLSDECKRKLSAYTLANPMSAEGRKRHADALRGVPRKVNRDDFIGWIKKGWDTRRRNAALRTCGCTSTFKCFCPREEVASNLCELANRT